MARAVLSILSFAMATQAIRSGRRWTGHVLAMAGAEFGLNYFTQFCPVNAAVGVDSCEGEPAEAPTLDTTLQRSLERVRS